MPSAPAAFHGLLPIMAAASLSACATTQAVDLDADPYEGFNRQMYAFNDGLDKAVLEPVAQGYRSITNEPVRTSVSNFVNNLGEPVTFANEVLQGKLPEAAGTVGRFLINTTIGVAGLFDPAASFGIERTDEDFGQTLGVWGIASGPYLVLPFLGSTSPRDLLGSGADMAMNPMNYAEFDGDDATRIALAGVDGLQWRESAIETVESVRAQIDPYVTVRRFYVRNRAALIGNSAPTAEETEKVPDYELDF